MDYTYKRLTGSDAQALKNLLKVFGEAFEDVPTYQHHLPTDEYLQKLLSKPHFIAITATQGDTVVGGLAAYELEKFEQDRREIYIYDLAVDVAHRRKGIATKLIGELQRIAKECGAYVIFVQADPGDEPAINLYTKLGTREDVHHFDILP